jgi:hypothetical protein
MAWGSYDGISMWLGCGKLGMHTEMFSRKHSGICTLGQQTRTWDDKNKMVRGKGDRNNERRAEQDLVQMPSKSFAVYYLLVTNHSTFYRTNYWKCHCLQGCWRIRNQENSPQTIFKYSIIVNIISIINIDITFCIF